ncbi:GNAT family N-acetyltransferase [Xenorhabdus bovienii]|uniref:GNAT family N-acetyltransferase n=1 Tax=Xenorhabdus bovienii TaxID=40576 RepID=UPI00237CAA66|nr:GNAT family N-acetyltransferase [Xenorhabdus bovienii]MDE1482505.1 GNAT family N-acetyltransferase [Xenorhabdus bovienii]MDE9482265.1 GNAT family N-acetyltransferase [Xenorhabdus bovienii]
MDAKIIIQSAEERTDLDEQIYDLVRHLWPFFMNQDPVAQQHWEKLYEPDFSRFQKFAILQQGQEERLIGLLNAIPFPWEQHSLDQLPDEGWDAVYCAGMAAKGKQQPALLSALSVTVAPEFRGHNVPALLINSVKQTAREAGLQGFVVPVRPSLKRNYPLQDFVQYCEWKNEKGEPFDPWIRTHWRLGAKIIKPALRSMDIYGTVAKWQEWTGMKFPQSGEYIIPGGLVPLLVDVEKQMGYYIEPNLWMFHSLG